MQPISKQQVRVFGLFSLALLMSGYAYAFSLLGEIPAAIGTGFLSLILTARIIDEARGSA